MLAKNLYCEGTFAGVRMAGRDFVIVAKKVLPKRDIALTYQRQKLLGRTCKAGD